MLAVADESFFSNSRMAGLTNGLLSFEAAAVQIGNDGVLKRRPRFYCFLLQI